MTSNVDRRDCGSWVLMNDQEQGFIKCSEEKEVVMACAVLLDMVKI